MNASLTAEQAVERFRRAQKARLAAGVHDEVTARELREARAALDAVALSIASSAPYPTTPVVGRHADRGTPRLHWRLNEAAEGRHWRRAVGDTVCASVEAGRTVAIGDAVPCPVCLKLMERHAVAAMAPGGAE